MSDNIASRFMKVVAIFDPQCRANGVIEPSGQDISGLSPYPLPNIVSLPYLVKSR